MIAKQRNRLLRIASTVHDRLLAAATTRRRTAFAMLSQVTEMLDDLPRLRQRFDWACQRAMTTASNRLIEQASRQLNCVASVATNVRQALDDACNQQTPRLSDILAELQQAEDDFDQPLQYDRSAATLSLTTGPIILDGLNLGQFQIRLNLKDFGQSTAGRAYRIIAKQPNPAAGNDHVTHPHVSSESLCEGDACTPIRNALIQGRLADFFNIVRGVLTTYNADSPYVRLDEWDGQPCYDCGSLISNGDAFYCEYCERDYCESCYGNCRVCDASLCYCCQSRCESCGGMYCPECEAVCLECHTAQCKTCMPKCPGCQRLVCDDCSQACDACSRRLCPSCMPEELCDTCQENNHNPTDEDDHDKTERVGQGHGNPAPPVGQAPDAAAA